MDEAPEGVIFLSLGTYTPDHLQGSEYFDLHINVFKQLRQRVLWKTKKDHVEGLPDNVMTLNWAPQKDILAHPKCVLFITHAGPLSTLEVFNFAVPVVAIPQFYDRHRNARLMEERGLGVRLNIDDLSEKTLLTAIRTVLNNRSYRDNAQRLSRIFRDRPLSPAQTVVFWTEHVLRHGAAHLKPASTLLSWYQLALLDLLATIFGVLTFCLVLIYMLFRQIIRIVHRKNVVNCIKLKKS